MYLGARKDLRNNEKMLPYNLASKFPECGRLLTDHKGISSGIGSDIIDDIMYSGPSYTVGCYI